MTCSALSRSPSAAAMSTRRCIIWRCSWIPRIWNHWSAVCWSSLMRISAWAIRPLWLRTIQAIDAARRIGMPEARIPLSMAVIDLALSPKSRSAESAIDAAAQAAHAKACQMPDYLKYTPTALHEEDRYDYGMSAIWPYIQYLPDELKDARFYSREIRGNMKKRWQRTCAS